MRRFVPRARALLASVSLALACGACSRAPDAAWQPFSEVFDAAAYPELHSTTRDRFEEVLVRKGLMIPMRDGPRLHTHVYRPAPAGAHPVVLIRTPYGIEEVYTYMPAIGSFWARKGYAVVTQDTRGKYASDGTYTPVVHEVEDAYDTIDWIVAQPWCNGRVGMTGDSYYGLTTWAGAMGGHPNLRAVAPSTISLDFYKIAYRNGAYALPTFGQWYLTMESRTLQDDAAVDYDALPLIDVGRAAGLRDTQFRRSIESWRRDDYWKRVSLHSHYDAIRVPALHMGGCYDIFLVGTLDDWQGIRAQAAATVRDQQWLWIGPWDHEWTPERTGRIGRRQLESDLRSARWDTLQAFFDHFLMDIGNGWQQRPRVEIFTMGDDHWRFLEDWPPPAAIATDFFLHSDGDAGDPDARGSLDRAAPGDEPGDHFEHDPANPVVLEPPTPGALFAWERAARLKDRRRLLERRDVLAYDSAPLDEALEITGPISVTLYASSSAVDTDFTAALVDVHPDGYSELIQEGIQRASFRASDTQPTPIVPDRIYAYAIDLWATSYAVPAGHRLRVEVSSSNHSSYYRNDNTGRPFGTSREMLRAAQTIHHDADHPSRIALPLIPRRAPGEQVSAPDLRFD